MAIAAQGDRVLDPVVARVRVLANAVASLPARVYRRQPDGSRVPAGADQRLVQLLARPEPKTSRCTIAVENRSAAVEPGSRRASGVRSGQDPGDADSDNHRLTPLLLGRAGR